MKYVKFPKCDNTRMITKINNFPHVYFMDAMYYFVSDLLPDESKTLESHKLDAYLSLFNIKNKLDTNHVENQNKMRLKSVDISDLLAYGIYDSIALYKAFEQRAIIMKRL